MKIQPPSAGPAGPRRTSLTAGVAPREVWSWACYDFANSGYTTVVVTAVFNAYFVAVVAQRAPWATLAWTTALGVSYALVMVAGPIVGAYADARAAKKRLLGWTTAGCVAGTAALAWVGPGDVALGMALVMLSNLCFSLGENLIAAFLPELAKGTALGRVSAWGWGLGYLGGLGSLAASLVYMNWKGGEAADFVPGAMVITALLFAVASLPTFAWLKERATPVRAPGAGEVFRRLADTLRHVRRHRDLARFLACIACYQAGVQAVVALAAIYAQEAMHFDTRQTLLMIVAVNVTAAAGALLFGYVQDRLGHRPTLALTLVAWIVTVLLAWSAQGPGLFWVAAHLAGLSLGASQSAGRALVGYLSPAARRAECFGLWGFAVKLASLLGPMTYGLATWFSGGDHRMAFLVTGIYFVAGLVILAGVDVRRGRKAALRADAAGASRRGWAAPAG